MLQVLRQERVSLLKDFLGQDGQFHLALSFLILDHFAVVLFG